MFCSDVPIMHVVFTHVTVHVIKGIFNIKHEWLKDTKNLSIRLDLIHANFNRIGDERAIVLMQIS